MNLIKHWTAAAVCVLCVGAWTPGVSAVTLRHLDDTFDDGNIGTNTLGAGTGFQIVSNPVLGTGSISESGGQGIVMTSGQNNDNTGVVSNDTLNVNLTDKVTAFWDVSSASNITANGIELLVQGGTGFRALDFIELKLRPTGTAEVIVNNTVVLSDTYTVGQALDGFTATLMADPSGWTLSTTGLPSLSMLSGGYGSSDFVSLFNGGRVAATVQGTGQTGNMTLNQITVDVVSTIPEPATAGLAVLGLSALGLAGRRRGARA